jgi:nucleoid DNA-binding protein
VTKAHLADRVYEVHGAITRSEATDIVETILDAVKEALVHGREVRLQNFGTIAVTRRQERGGVDPTNGRRIQIPARRGLSFRPARRLKDALAERVRG